MKFIPYEPVITNGSNNDIFDDINAGKIGLNNAELIKALLVQESNLINHTGEGHRIDTIAIEWDSVEQTLQDKEFWGFIYSSKHFTTYDTHIEYLLDLIYDKSENNIDNEYFTFDKVNAEYRKASDKLEFAEATWRKIRDMFDTLVEWYNDRKFYHRIGYLLEYGNDITITKLIAHLKGNKKGKQIAILDNLISDSLKTVNAEKLFYKKSELSQILLLYNALAEDRRIGATARFSFADYKNIKDNKIGWDQEHIASNTDATANQNEREKFALDLIEFFTGERNISPSETILDMLNEKEQAFVKRLSIAGDMEQDFKPEDLTILFNDIMEYFNTNNDGFNEAAPMKNSRICSEKDFIWNFALLNAGTNRSYGNALFPVKRKRILNDEFEVYTPVGTRNVFEKAYSRKLTNMMSWTRDDAKAYWEELCTVLKPYITLVFPFKNY